MLDRIVPRYLLSKCFVDARSNENDIIAQSQPCNILLKKLIAIYISVLQIHNKVEQALLRFQLHGHATHGCLNTHATAIVANCRIQKGHKFVKFMNLRISQTL